MRAQTAQRRTQPLLVEPAEELYRDEASSGGRPSAQEQGERDADSQVLARRPTTTAKAAAIADARGSTAPGSTAAALARCPPPPPLAFPRRLAALPLVRALTGAYSQARESRSLLSCLLLSGEMAALVAAAPALVVAGPVRTALATPIYVADMLLCKGLDVAERVFPCLASTPVQICKGTALCACGVPAGVCYLASKFSCKALRTCLFDLPAVACGVPALVCCSAAEICLCDAPAALCAVPANITRRALHTAVRDAQHVMQVVEECCAEMVP